MRISDWSSDVCSSDLRVLADLIERADEGRVLRGNRRRADGGGQRIAPGERVGIGERRGSRIEAVEQVEGGRAQLSADKIGYISIISCNINILHRMLCESFCLGQYTRRGVRQNKIPFSNNKNHCESNYVIESKTSTPHRQTI